MEALFYLTILLVWEYPVELFGTLYIIMGLLYLRHYKTYIDHSMPYKLVLGWIIFPFYIFVSDLKNGKNVIRLRDEQGRAHRLLITKHTKFLIEGSEEAENEQ